MEGQENGQAVEMPLPPRGNFTKIRLILDEDIKANVFVNVIGVIRDYRPPMRSKGSDYKSAISFFDKSTEEDMGAMLTINIFRPSDEMPEISAGDVILIYGAKVQSWGGPSLISNYQTTIYIYSASRIPKPPKTAVDALCPLMGSKGSRKAPSDAEHAYVSWLYHNVDRYLIPEAAAFTVAIERTSNPKDKFKLFKDLKDYVFCNAIAQVVTQPFTNGDCSTMWLSDYTSHEAFKRFSPETNANTEGVDGDPFGYTTGAQKEWPGPYGQRSLQVTAWGVHASNIDANVSQGDWLMIRNMQVKFGRDGLFLEGFIREERDQTRNPILQVEVLHIDDGIDERFKEALRRKRAYEKARKKGGEGTDPNSQAKNTRKHEADQPERENRKTKRQKRNAEIKRKEMELEAQKKAAEGRGEEIRRQEEVTRQEIPVKPYLNRSIKCESTDHSATRVASIIEPVTCSLQIDGDRDRTLVPLPFVNSKHRVVVRVVDFAPRKLQDFARWRQKQDYDILSDDSGDDSENEDGSRHGTLEPYRGEKIWEWRFALQLEEADQDDSAEQPARFWVVVDNIEGQQLTNLNACDLRADSDHLNRLKEQLFKLWGNLEEIKAAERESSASRRERIDAHKPPESSPPRGLIGQPDSLSNTPFTCCVRQYGVSVHEEDPARANAGHGRRWQRMFGIFGTRISSVVAVQQFE